MKDLIDVLEKFAPKRLELAGEQSQIDRSHSFYDMLEMLYLCEATSEHPLARAILKKVKEDCPYVDERS